MLPGVGIFGSDPISKILIQLLRHFEFEIHGIWTNHYEIDSATFVSSNDLFYDETCIKNFPKLVTTSIDNVLLNKNVNLVFVCCQPNLHSQISSKALGIGKNVICLFPTCKNSDDILQMINSARYYPSLMSSISYGGLRFLSEFKLIKQYMSLIGDVKLCNIVINCQNISICRSNDQKNYERSSSTSSKSSLENNKERQASLSSLIDNIAYLASSTTSLTSIHWLNDRDLGAGVLNRFGAAMISLVLHLFNDKKVTRVFGTLKTFVDDLDSKNFPNKQLSESETRNNILKSDLTNSSKQKQNVNLNQRARNQIRKITADDHCTFQMCLEPSSLIVNVTINSLAQCKYSQEIAICGNQGTIVWKNSKLTLRSTSNNNLVNDLVKSKLKEKKLNRLGDDLNDSNLSTDSNNNNSASLNKNSESDSENSEFQHMEIELRSDDPVDINSEKFLNKYKNVEMKHPELPLMFIKGLYYYLARVKKEFTEKKTNNMENSETSKQQAPLANLENFEHTRIVQSIIKHICLSSEKNRWVSVNY